MKIWTPLNQTDFTLLYFGNLCSGQQRKIISRKSTYIPRYLCTNTNDNIVKPEPKPGKVLSMLETPEPEEYRANPG